MTHRADPGTDKPVCGGHGMVVNSDPACHDCRHIERNYPHLLWTAEQHKAATEMFASTFRGGR